MPIHFFKHLADQNSEHLSRIVPPEPLKEIVEGFYVCKAGYPGERTLFFNDGYPVVALMQDQDENVSVRIDGHAKCLGNTWVCGGVLKNIYRDADLAFGDCFVVRFYPVTFFKLFDIPENYFQQNQVSDLSEIAGYGFEKFRNAYYHASDAEERINIVFRFLSEKMRDYIYPQLLTDIQNYMNTQAKLKVKDILDNYAVRLNYKWLERNFKRHLGIAPQDYLLIRRFLNAYLDLDASNAKDLLQVALDNGYYDDNHFIKDFRRFSGLPPKTYFNQPLHPNRKAVASI